MMNDCQNGKIDIIVTKSISRFGRNTAETLKSLNDLKSENVDVFFENEGMHSKDSENTFILSLMEGIAQEESFNKSKNIRWGILRKIENGTAKLLRRKCYGYSPGEDDELKIQQDEARVVKEIFDMYLSGASIIGIQRELERRAILSPTGNTKWCKRTIENLLLNEKYTGNVVACKTYNEGYPETRRYINKGDKEKYIVASCNPEIISEEQFKQVQEERTRRSNVERDEDRTVRKTTHYSSKQKA
jgi:DNA invertase Pin-like site-specific DNA recombinase